MGIVVIHIKSISKYYSVFEKGEDGMLTPKNNGDDNNLLLQTYENLLDCEKFYNLDIVVLYEIKYIIYSLNDIILQHKLHGITTNTINRNKYIVEKNYHLKLFPRAVLKYKDDEHKYFYRPRHALIYIDQTNPNYEIFKIENHRCKSPYIFISKSIITGANPYYLNQYFEYKKFKDTFLDHYNDLRRFM